MSQQVADAGFPNWQPPVVDTPTGPRFGAVVQIPATFQVDGHGFSYYLKSNEIDFNMSSLRADLNGKSWLEFWFSSNAAAELARTVWYNLTGCQILGKLNTWQNWGQFVR